MITRSQAVRPCAFKNCQFYGQRRNDFLCSEHSSNTTFWHAPELIHELNENLGELAKNWAVMPDEIFRRKYVPCVMRVARTYKQAAVFLAEILEDDAQYNNVIYFLTADQCFLLADIADDRGFHDVAHQNRSIFHNTLVRICAQSWLMGNEIERISMCYWGAFGEKPASKKQFFKQLARKRFSLFQLWPHSTEKWSA